MIEKHKIYLKKLSKKEIKVEPLENYINSTTKILHKCICGNEWNVTPKKALLGAKCGCGRNKFNHGTYIKQLIKNNIECIPLETYINNSTKILHKCECGAKWKVKPCDILNKVKCQYCNKITHSKYLEKLNKKEIKIEPLEEYILSAIPIKHKCECGNIWKTTPQRVLQYKKCGKCSLNGYNRYKNKRMILYYIYFNEEKIYKIGITEFRKDIEYSIYKNRYTMYKKDEIKIIKTKIFQKGEKAAMLEKKIIIENRDIAYIGEKVLKQKGDTECFTENINIDKYI